MIIIVVIILSTQIVETNRKRSHNFYFTVNIQIISGWPRNVHIIVSRNYYERNVKPPVIPMNVMIIIIIITIMVAITE